jgi:signal transduction histidine kinase
MVRFRGVGPHLAAINAACLICILAVIGCVALYALEDRRPTVGPGLALVVGGCLGLAALGLRVLLPRRPWAAFAAPLGLLSVLTCLTAIPVFVRDLGPPGYVAPAVLLVVVVTQILATVLWYNLKTARPTFTTIRARLLSTCVLLVLFTGGTISSLSMIALRHQEEDEAVDRLSTVATLTQRQVDDWTNSMLLALELFARNASPQLTTLLDPQTADAVTLGAARDHLQADLKDTLVQGRLYEVLYVLDRQGTVIVAAGGSARLPSPPSVACLQQAFAGPCLEPPRYYSALDRVAVVAAEPVMGVSGQVEAVVAGYAGLAALDQITAGTAGLGRTGVTYLVGADHSLLTSGRALPAGGAGPSPTRPVYTEGTERALATRAGGAGFYTGYDGQPVVGVYRWLPELQTALVAEEDQTEAFGSSTQLSALNLSLTLILLAAAVLMALYIVRHITAPLSRLAATADQIAHGALNLTADVKGDDEISTLAGAFNGMMARLRQARDELEQRVAQRTAELARANASLQEENTVRRRAEHALQNERNKLERILDAMEDAVYIVNPEYQVEYTNPALSRTFGPLNGRPCYAYLYGRGEVCPWCPNAEVWQGRSVHREVTLPDGRTCEVFDTPVTNVEGRRSKLAIYHDVTARTRAEEEIRQRNRELATLSRRLVEVQESERQYISRELHDETGQALATLMLGLGLLERDLHSGLPVAGRVTELKRTVDEVLEGLHGLAMDLRPASLDHVGLVPALRQYTERVTERYQLAVDFSAIGLEEERLPPAVEITIYRIVQEALVNVVRHAHATHADVIVERGADRVRILIEDNGVGFEPATALDSGRLGLIGMRERAETLRGQLVIDSVPGTGTTLLVEVPYDRAHPDRG